MVLETVLCQKIQLVSADADLLQSPGHPNLSKYQVENVSEIEPFNHINRLIAVFRLDQLPDDWRSQKDLFRVSLSVLVGTDLQIPFTDGGQHDATGLTVADAQRTELMSNGMTRTERDAAPDGAHGEDDAPLGLEASGEVGRVAMRPDQRGHESQQAFLRLRVPFLVGQETAQRLDTVVDRPHPGAQPDAFGRRRGQFRVEHHQARVARRRLEQAFSIAAVVARHARDALVLASGERRRNRHVPDHGVLEARPGVGLGVEQLFHTRGIRNIVGQHPRDHLGRVRQ